MCVRIVIVSLFGIQILLLSSKCGCYGLNFKLTNYFFLFTPLINIFTQIQLVNRISRFSNKNQPNIFDLYGLKEKDELFPNQIEKLVISELILTGKVYKVKDILDYLKKCEKETDTFFYSNVNKN
jgi:hypothetical protein